MALRKYVPGWIASGNLMRNAPTGTGDAIVVAVSGNCRPLPFSTSTTFALTINLWYFATITRFSISTKLISGFMRPQIEMPRTCTATVGLATGTVNHKL